MRNVQPLYITTISYLLLHILAENCTICCRTWHWKEKQEQNDLITQSVSATDLQTVLYSTGFCALQFFLFSTNYLAKQKKEQEQITQNCNAATVTSIMTLSLLSVFPSHTQICSFSCLQNHPNKVLCLTSIFILTLQLQLCLETYLAVEETAITNNC